MATSKAENSGGIKEAGKKMMERIRKLLAMAGDVSSPNEAAIAARRAERLMAEYNLTNADILTAGLSLDDFEERFAGAQLKRLPQWIDILGVAVARYTGCHVRKVRVPGTVKMSLKFLGEKSDLEICIYLWTYLTRVIEKLCDESGVKHIGPRTSFKMACSSEVCKTLRRMREEDKKQDATVTGNNKALILVDKKAELMRQKFGIARYKSSSGRYSDNSAAAAGREAGRGVSIRKAVNTAANVRRLT